MKLAKIILAEHEIKHKNKCGSSPLYICVISIIFAMNIGIYTYFAYYNYMYHDEKTSAKYDSFYQTTI